MHKDFWGWSLESAGTGTVETKYILEYVNDEKTWDRICYIDDHYGEIEPHQESYELYTKAEFDNVSEAISLYMSLFASDKCFDVKFWEQIYVNGDMVLEQMLEPKSTVMYEMRTVIDNEMRDRMSKAESSLKEAEKEIELYEAFLKKCHANEEFKKFMETYEEEK